MSTRSGATQWKEIFMPLLSIAPFLPAWCTLATPNARYQDAFPLYLTELGKAKSDLHGHNGGSQHRHHEISRLVKDCPAGEGFEAYPEVPFRLQLSFCLLFLLVILYDYLSSCYKTAAGHRRVRKQPRRARFRCGLEWLKLLRQNLPLPDWM